MSAPLERKRAAPDRATRDTTAHTANHSATLRGAQHAPKLHPLPPYGRAIVAMLDRHERPRIFGGAIVAVLAWEIAHAWPRVVIPDDPASYRLDFARGLDWLVLARIGHPQSHVAAVVQALRAAGARIVAPVMLPYTDEASA